MYYIRRSPSRKQSKVALAHLGPALIVLASFLGLTLWSWRDTTQNVQEDVRQRAARELEAAESSLTQRLQTYDAILNAGVSLFSGQKGAVSRQDWQSFAEGLSLSTRYPGLQGIGYSQRVDQAKLGEFTQNVRDSGITNYSVRPTGSRGQYAPILYLEPQTEQNTTALGFDLYSEMTRKKAMDTAAQSKQISLSEPVNIIQNNTPTNEMGLLMFAPYFGNQKQAEAKGYVYVPFRSIKFAQQTIETNQNHIGYGLYAELPNANTTTLYTSPNLTEVQQQPTAQTTSSTVEAYGQKWMIQVSTNALVLSPRDQSRPVGVLWGGTLFSMFVAGFIYLLLVNRGRRIVQKEQAEVQLAKDELLALASHQLRTPATGVKQYIGLLREGYAGELSKEQREFLDKAYASNERQLDTINDILVTAKADTGHLDLALEPTEINQMVQSITDEAQPEYTAKKQVVTLHLARKPLYCFADPGYLRMAIENIINNAGKYTRDGGSITITVLSKKNKAHLIVRDTGVGVDKNDYPLLFEKFARIPNELTKRVGGSGIGLYLAQKIIDAHQGSITFESELGKGSVCTLILPVIQNSNQ